LIILVDGIHSFGLAFPCSTSTQWFCMFLNILDVNWVWVNTYRYIFSGMNIHLPDFFWGSLGTRVLTHPQFPSGTGKTVVARMVGQLLVEMGVIKKAKPRLMWP